MIVFTSSCGEQHVKLPQICVPQQLLLLLIVQVQLTVVNCTCMSDEQLSG